MCTVTYLPTGKDAFILTSNRDESSIRPTHPPTIAEVDGLQLLFPKDTFAGGSWICLSDQNRMVNLLNGAFEKHEWNPPYRKSRGLVLLDIFKYSKPDQFISEYDLDGIEPFTMVIYDQGNLSEFRWDGKERSLKSKSPDQPHIWSSASLYPKHVREKRKEWFETWLKGRKQYDSEEILHFHKHGGEGDKENDLIMNRYNMVQTVSITSIIKEPGNATMIYNDLIKNTAIKASIKFKQTREALGTD